MGHRKEVFMVQKGEKKNYWTKIGVAFVNRDGSLNVQLNAVPITGQLHIRDPREVQLATQQMATGK